MSAIPAKSTDTSFRKTKSGYAVAAPRPVVWLATVGALFIALELYVFGSWILSADFTPSPKGSDPIPDWIIWMIRSFESLSVLLTFVVLYFVWRTSRREGRLSLFGILALAWWPVWWQDMIYMWARPVFFYNAYFLNMGNWAGHIPGWVNPTAKLEPEPLLFIGGVYLWFTTLGSMITVWAMSWGRRRWPSMSAVQLCVLGLTTMFFYDLLIEVTWIRTGLYAYPATIHALSVWGGKMYQFPVYESVFWGAVMAAPGIVYFFRDDKGRTVLDRGLDRVKAVRYHSLLRWLAMVAFINIAYMIFNCIMIPITFHVDATPEGYPSWLRNGMCGQGTGYPCPGPNVPIFLPASPPQAQP